MTYVILDFIVPGGSQGVCSLIDGEAASLSFIIRWCSLSCDQAISGARSTPTTADGAVSGSF